MGCQTPKGGQEGPLSEAGVPPLAARTCQQPLHGTVDAARCRRSIGDPGSWEAGMDPVTRVQGQQQAMLTGDGDTRLVREVRCVSEAITRMASASCTHLHDVFGPPAWCRLPASRGAGQLIEAWRQSAEACTRQTGRRAF